MTTITASSTVGITLSSPAFTNPVVVRPGVSISNTGNAIKSNSGSWTLQNNGAVTGSGPFGDGIYLSAGGSVTNFASGSVTGSSIGVFVGGSAGTVLNYGNITGRFGASPIYSGIGIYLRSGGVITNRSGAMISGYGLGINVYENAGTVINAGRISGQNYAGIELRGGGTITNQANGTISGGDYGIVVSGATGIAINAGTIAGGIYLDSGGVITNQASGVIIGGAAHSGVTAIGGAATVINAGSISGGVSFSGGYNNLLVVDPGASFGGSVNGSNAVRSNLELAADGGARGSLTGIGTQFTNFGSIVFDVGGSWFIAGNTAGLSGTITGFAAGDTIELTGVTATGSNYAGGVLTIEEAAGSASLHLPGAFTTASFNVVTVADGTDISLRTHCFCTGTRILTDRGEVPIELLEIGDLVMTASGMRRPITWIGTGCMRATPGQRDAATPVVVRKGAVDENVPNCDLRLTKGHSLFIDHVLIPVEFLVNHRSIVWDDHARKVEIYHIELGTHDVLLANGTPAESYRDDGNRCLFHNASAGWSQEPQEPCAELLTGGPLVDAIWQRLLERAGSRPGLPLTEDPDLHLLIDGRRVDGTSREDRTFAFHLPRVPECARIISRAGVPQELGVGRDHRMLGVAIRRILVWQGRTLRVIEAGANSLCDGFHQFEPVDGHRWTNGDAALPDTLFAELRGPCTLELAVSCTMRYPLITTRLAA